MLDESSDYQMSSEFVNTCEEYFRKNNIDPMKILRIPEQILTKSVLVAAYKEQALLHHPDRRGGDKAKFSLLSTCYKYLWEKLQCMTPDLPTVGNTTREDPPSRAGPSGTMRDIRGAAPLKYNTVVNIEGYVSVAKGKNPRELIKWEDLQPAESPNVFDPSRAEYATFTRVGDRTVFRSSMLSEDWNPNARRGPDAGPSLTDSHNATMITKAHLDAYRRPELQPAQLGRPNEQEWRYAARVREEREQEDRFMEQFL